MPSPAICIRDTSISNGQILVKDMWPNRSQANPVVDPAPQGPRYLRVAETTTLPTVAAGVVTTEVRGLAAYLLVNLDDGANDPAVGASITSADAKTIADALVAEMRAGNTLDLAAINAVVAVTVATAGVGVATSTASVEDILQILAGARYVVPAGHVVEVAGVFQPVATSFFDYGIVSPVLEEDSSFWISVAKGDLLGLKSTRTVGGAVVDPYVVVYDGLGNVL
jgi:hypothetical protein